MPEALVERSENLDRNETEPTMFSVMVGLMRWQCTNACRGPEALDEEFQRDPLEVRTELRARTRLRGDKWLSHQRSRGASALSAFLNALRVRNLTRSLCRERRRSVAASGQEDVCSTPTTSGTEAAA